MHTSELTRDTYTPDEASPTFQDEAIAASTLKSGELVRRFDPMAFPQLGVKYTGSDNDGDPVPATAIAG